MWGRWSGLIGAKLFGLPSCIRPHTSSPLVPRREFGDTFAHGNLVLVVDDNAGSQWHVCKLLAQWGIQPQLAADGAEAVALARDNSFALILMDLQMPVLDGLAATQQIRRYEREQSYARAPVVVYTSRDVYAGDNLLQESGVDAVLAKPCDAATLRACLIRWCTPEVKRELALAHS